MLITPEDLLFQAVKAGDLQKVRTLLKEVEGSSLNVRDESVCAPIHYAACLETTEVLEALIEAGADLNRRDEHEWTALHYAAFDGRLQAVR
jgi:ankyrin repeat protein